CRPHDAVAAADAGGGQRPGQPPGAVVELGPSQAHVTADGRQLVGPAAGVLGEHVGQGEVPHPCRHAAGEYGFQTPAASSSMRAPTSASPRRVSLRWVHVVVPRRLARPHGRRSPTGWPTSSGALPTAAGHSAHGSTSALATTERTMRLAASTNAETPYSCTTVSRPSPSTWLSRKNTFTGCAPPSARPTSMRRRRRIPCGASSA